MINKTKPHRGVFVDDSIGETGEYTRDHHTRDTSHYIVGKNVFIPSLVHRKVFVVYTNYMYTWYIQWQTGTVYLLIVDFKQFGQFNRNMW